MRGDDNRPRDNINMTEEMIDVLAHAMIRQMTPLEIGLILHPTAIAVELKHVPAAIIADHRSRYSKAELRRGQFFRIGAQYTFIMDHAAYDKRQK